MRELVTRRIDPLRVGFDDGPKSPPTAPAVVRLDLEVDEFIGQGAGDGEGAGDVGEGDETLTAVGQVGDASAVQVGGSQLRRSTTRTRRSFSVQMICATSQKSWVRTISLGVSFCHARTPPR